MTCRLYMSPVLALRSYKGYRHRQADTYVLGDKANDRVCISGGLVSSCTSSFRFETGHMVKCEYPHYRGPRVYGENGYRAQEGQTVAKLLHHKMSNKFRARINPRSTLFHCRGDSTSSRVSRGG